MKRIIIAALMAATGLLATATPASAASYKICNATSCQTEDVFAWFWETSSYAKTRYPIVFAHGMAGFSKIGPLDYCTASPRTCPRTARPST
jgi:triacylglycerol lipase